MNIDDRVIRRLNELAEQSTKIRIERDDYIQTVNQQDWHEWATSVLSLFKGAFGPDSSHYQNFKKIYDGFDGMTWQKESAVGVFFAARADYGGGYMFNLRSMVSGEVFGDFVALARKSLDEGFKDVAVVLASAALEDALKRYAEREGLQISDKDMSEVVAALKAKGLVGGAQKQLLDSMPKIRNYAMHANWSKISDVDTASIIGFVEQFILSKFS